MVFYTGWAKGIHTVKCYSINVRYINVLVHPVYLLQIFVVVAHYMLCEVCL